MTLRALLVLAGCFWMSSAVATTVYVMSIGRDEAQVILNGSTVRMLRVGETAPEGVKLTEVRGSTAYFEVDGAKVSMGIGASTQSQAVLRADSRGHFAVNALINGVPVPAIIDTGASVVTVNGNDARRMGIDLRQARRGTSNSANGPVPMYYITFAQVRVGDVTLVNVPGAVIEGGTDRLGVALIGMSFLKYVEMRRSGDTMTLSRPNF